MKVQVRFAAQLRQLIGQSQRTYELPDESLDLATLIERLAEWHPTARSHLLAESQAAAASTSALSHSPTTDRSPRIAVVRPSLLIAVNDRAVAPNSAHSTRLTCGDVVSLLPPIAGG